MFDKLRKLLPGKAIVKVDGQKSKAIVDRNNVDSLIQFAIQSQAGLEQLKEVMKMKYEHEAREAKKKFHYEFCRLQADLPEIPKDKDVKNDRKELLYSYSSLPMIVKTIKPFTKQYGFSFGWSEESIKDGVKRIHNHITGYGHTESTYVDIPIMAPNRMTNSTQQMGSATTYGKRYSICNSLGIVSDEDDDGRSNDDKPATQNKSSKPPAVKEDPDLTSSTGKPYKGSVRQNLIEIIWKMYKEVGCKTKGEGRDLAGIPFDTDFTIPIERLDELREELEKRKKYDAEMEKKQNK